MHLNGHLGFDFAVVAVVAEGELRLLDFLLGSVRSIGFRIFRVAQSNHRKSGRSVALDQQLTSPGNQTSRKMSRSSEQAGRNFFSQRSCSSGWIVASHTQRTPLKEKSIGQTSKVIFGQTLTGGTKVDKYFTNRGDKGRQPPQDQVRLGQVRIG